MENTILVTTAPIFQKIGANYFMGEGKRPFIGIDVKLRKNEEIVAGEETDLDKNPRVIAKDVLNGPTGWFKRGLVKRARRVVTESIQIEGETGNDDPPLISGESANKRELPGGDGLSDSVDPAMVAARFGEDGGDAPVVTDPELTEDEQIQAMLDADKDGDVDPLLEQEKAKNGS